MFDQQSRGLTMKNAKSRKCRNHLQAGVLREVRLGREDVGDQLARISFEERLQAANLA